MNILDAVLKTTVVLKKVASTKGGEYAGHCPGCGGTDRFRVWPAEKGGAGSYWCRGCSKGGDTVQFLVDFLGYEYKEAFRLCDREMPASYRPVGRRPVDQIKKEDYQPIEHLPPVETWQIRATKFVDAAHQDLIKNEKTLVWLEKNRGLDITAVKLFKLGWFGGENDKPAMYRSRESWGLSTIKKNDGKKKKLFIPRGLVIPYYLKGVVARIRIRRPKIDLKTDKDVKYYIVPGSSMGSMIFSTKKDGGRGFVVVEAELDAMLIARQIGSMAGVVALGSVSNKPSKNIYYYLKKALRILVALDYDKAGVQAFKWWQENFKNAREWPTPAGKDPGEAYKAGENIKDWVEAGLPPVMTLLNRYEKMLGVPEGLFPIQELAYFLKKYPIKIIADQDRGEIIFDSGFNNKQIKTRVNQLFFNDEEIFYYLKIHHPDQVIQGDNFDFLTKEEK
ncbi:MAG: toprim domain-containing protein [Desulfobacterales bacterium]|nr:toprim domain-containing protein [Desulfobacterales bacterium]